ncbi:hypothetical protein ABZP36_025484 [Zizania latifolia]
MVEFATRTEGMNRATRNLSLFDLGINLETILESERGIGEKEMEKNVGSSISPAPSPSAVPIPPPARHSRKHLAGREGSSARLAKPRVFLLDVNPLRFRGSQRSLVAFASWLALFLSHVGIRDLVVAVRMPLLLPPSAMLRVL